ncbi:MAG TPA: MarR family transcriptional regulator [Kofleriaceae bacterium]|nr:MarR family transcriptional regulator [Kofleriaceae bacterium]
MSRDDHILRVVDAVGGLIEFWGFKRNMGRMWTLLYLEQRPLSAADLSERLSLSSGAVSMTLTELQKWGVVKKAWVPGERREYYEPETSIWKMVSRVFRERELRQIHQAIEVFEDAIEVLESETARGNDDDKERVSFALERVRGLLNLARIGANLLDAILSGKSVDASPLKLFRDE